MVQTPPLIFDLALAISRANARRIQNRQKGTMGSTSLWRQLEQHLKFNRNLRHVDSTMQRALV